VTQYGQLANDRGSIGSDWLHLSRT